MSKEKGGHTHGEAFKHMIYTCTKCSRNLSIWNTRDGVTPFAISCRFKCCEGDMMHGNWDTDRYDPLYRPKVGDFIWGDFQVTENEALELADMRIKVISEANPELEIGGPIEFEKRRHGIKQYFLDEMKKGAPALYYLDSNRMRQKA